MKHYLILFCGLLMSCSRENLTPEKAAEIITKTYNYPSPVTGFIQLSYDPRDAETWFSVSELEGSGFLMYDTAANKEYPLIPPLSLKNTSFLRRKAEQNHRGQLYSGKQPHT